MSVFLFGNITKDGKWEGEWYFPKNRNKSRKFSYSRTGDHVEKDFIDYVSFTRTSSEMAQGRRKGKKGFRGISKKSHVETSSVEPAREDEKDTDAATSSESTIVNEGHITAPTAVVGTDGDAEMKDTKQNEDPDHSGEPEPEHIAIPHTHPIFGAYEGSFKIPNHKGIEEEIRESFFFFALHKDAICHNTAAAGASEGGACPPLSYDDDDESADTRALSSLPPAPRWTSAYIRALHEDSQMHATDLPTAPASNPIRRSDMTNEEISVADPLAGGGHGYVDITAQGASNGGAIRAGVDGKGGDEHSPGGGSITAIDSVEGTACDSAVTVGIGGSGDMPVIPEETVEMGSECHGGGGAEVKTEKDSLEGACASMRNESTHSEEAGIVHIKPVIQPPADEVMVVGFGRNVYGRFSLVGAYNETTGTLKCERKYMLTKTVNRPHRTRTPSTASDVDYVSTSTARGSFPISASGSGSEEAMGRVTRDGSVVGVGATGCAIVGPDRRSCGKRRRINSTVSVTDSVDGGDWSLAQGELTSASFSSSATTAGQLIEGYRSAFLDDTTGEVYEGGWCNGLRHGYGVAVFVDGSMYEGSWVNGREHGQGQWMSSNRQVLYKGEWADGRMHGSGTFNFPNGDMYTGEWKEGSRHGRGEYLLADGTRYYGEWKDNLRHGKGTLTWVDGSVYEGEYDRGYRHGRGELRLSNGFYYSGSWDMDYMDGRGVSIFSDGQQYQGMFRRGLRDGRGSVTFSEGAVYEGRFRDDVIDGQGTIKISQRVPGPVEGEFMIPLEMQSDIRRIHYRAGFGGGDH